MLKKNYGLILFIRKTDFCLCEDKGADQLCSICEADQRLCLRYRDILQFLYFLDPKFPACSHLLCFKYSTARFVGLVLKRQCCFSHDMALRF